MHFSVKVCVRTYENVAVVEAVEAEVVLAMEAEGKLSHLRNRGFVASINCNLPRRRKNNIRDVGSTADLVLVLLVHLVHLYLVHGLIGTSGALVPGTLVPHVT